MHYGKFFPEPEADAYERAGEHNWSQLEAIGGGMVGHFKRSIEKQNELADLARQRGDRHVALRHDDAADRLYDQLETWLEYIGDAQ